MIRFVVDSSVAAKWIFPGVDEEFSDEAAQFVTRSAKGEFQLLVPDLFWLEMAKILWKAARKGRCTTDTARQGLSYLRTIALETLPTNPLAETALALALATDRTAYDCAYVVLAVNEKATLISADRRLVNAVGDRMPVRWLGSPALLP